MTCNSTDLIAIPPPPSVPINIPQNKPPPSPSDSSDSNIPVTTTHTMSSGAYTHKNTTVEHADATKPPVLQPGILTPEDCPNGFPNGDTYRPLMEHDALAKKPSVKKPITTVTNDSTITVVMPPAVVGDGSDSDKCVAPFSVPHFFWNCLLSGPNSSSPIVVQSLIDNGLHTVLIDDNLVKRLGLQHCRLTKPTTVSVALQEDKVTYELLEYVKLSPSSLNYQWCS
ncbi:hypothetical protein BV22DRAFT_1134155 [Leucogyrophana mollusca]|uniref:Uncharacterized protein n=1 Tax=Leucogyrophana mollusca TaxID=85980 RepID=A0ACB8B1M4_9AGAM|nr:hypothetical protein BV22DRAFT_1134155 [Leucogyrophana mollusca]